MSTYHTTCTDEIVCPYCGHIDEQREAPPEAYGPRYVEFDCAGCGKTMELYVDMTLLYYTRKLTNQPKENEG